LASSRRGHGRSPTRFDGASGSARGEIVPAWLPNGEEALLAWFAANAAGCVFAPLNTAYRGRVPAHARNVTCSCPSSLRATTTATTSIACRTSRSRGMSRSLTGLPRNPALRVDKPQLRERGIPAGAWDREAAGIALQRDGF
jgi:hypothetical protein